MENGEQAAIHPFEALGGLEGIGLLVEAFYNRVQQDEYLMPLFADSDFQEVKRKQALFLSQFLGGPSLYSTEFGHPMLRFRHMPFAVTPDRANAWLSCMKEAMDDVGMQGMARDYFFGRLVQVAQHMVNSDDSNVNGFGR